MRTVLTAAVQFQQTAFPAIIPSNGEVLPPSHVSPNALRVHITTNVVNNAKLATQPALPAQMIQLPHANLAQEVKFTINAWTLKQQDDCCEWRELMMQGSRQVSNQIYKGNLYFI